MALAPVTVEVVPEPEAAGLYDKARQLGTGTSPVAFDSKLAPAVQVCARLAGYRETCVMVSPDDAPRLKVKLTKKAAKKPPATGRDKGPKTTAVKPTLELPD